MRRAALLVLGLASIAGCASSTDTPSGSEPTPHVASSPPADEPLSLADEASRTDLVCSAEEETGEAQEPLGWLTATCMVFVGLGFHIGCTRGVLNRYCPRGTHKVIQDTMDKSKLLSIDCDWLQDVICVPGAVGAGEVMREACGAVP